jgi:hypothetical protein
VFSALDAEALRVVIASVTDPGDHVALAVWVRSAQPLINTTIMAAMMTRPITLDDITLHLSAHNFDHFQQ